MKIYKTASYMEHLAGRFTRSGNFKYKCDQCGEFTFLTKKDRSKASIPRCTSCGSAWLNPVTENAKNKMLEISDEYNNSVNINQDKTNFKNKRMDRELQYL